MLGAVEDDLREKINIGTVPVWNEYNAFGYKNENWKQWSTPWGQSVQVPEKFNITQDENNVYMYAKGDTQYPPAAKMPKSSYFFDATERQNKIIDENSLDPKENMEEFALWQKETVKDFKQQFNKYKDTDYVICFSPGGMAIGDIAIIPGLNLTQPKGIRNVEEWYVSTVLRTDYLHSVFEHQTKIAIANLESIKDFCGGIECVVSVCGTDFGTQIGTFCSLETFKELYAPYYKEINQWIHKNTKRKTFKHSCGAVESFFPGFIDAGFDIINPVQWTAAGMDKKYLKDTYGDDLVFWGGGIDTQKTLPFGTKEEVRNEVLKTCEVFSKNGGFVFNTIHNIQANVPAENLAVMFQALADFNS